MSEASARYVHGHHDSVLRSHRRRTVDNSAAYLLPELTPTSRLLDVGCGPGTVTSGLAAILYQGEVVGVDAAAEVLPEARAEAARQGRSNLSFQVGDVYRLDFADQTFDVVHAHQLLQHLADPAGALQEMRRVCRRGGVVAARDSDYGGMSWYPDDPELEEWRLLYRQVARAVGGEPDAGRRMLLWARRAGFECVEVSASAWCFATPADRAWWGGLWAERLRQSSFAGHALRLELTTPADLERLAAAWARWASAEDGCFVLPHVEIICRT